ncbi:MAG TPA: organic hydroperoxide resistance protein [Burkholderiaceae bacterium]|nr:organic hydroperoxide resistance protein [Burkholderiaceae bacterium]
MSPEKVLYTARATATGGREGTAHTDDGRLSVDLSTPTELGGGGGSGTNPEQLFACGYAACFLGALKLVAGKADVNLPDNTSVQAEIGIGPIDTGFGLTADLTITAAGVDKDTLQDLVQQANVVCPYSNATQNNINVNLSVA